MFPMSTKLVQVTIKNFENLPKLELMIQFNTIGTAIDWF